MEQGQINQSTASNLMMDLHRLVSDLQELGGERRPVGIELRHAGPERPTVVCNDGSMFEYLGLKFGGWSEVAADTGNAEGEGVSAERTAGGNIRRAERQGSGGLQRRHNMGVPQW